MSERMLINVQDHVADVRFNRPDKLNALDPEQIEAIIAAGEEVAAMSDVRAVVLSGEGRGFCAGLDLATFQQAAGEGADPSTLFGDLNARTHGDANKYQQVVMVWRRLNVPVIAAVHGACLGGGLQLASAADIRIVAPDAQMSIMEMRWGIIPDMGSFTTWRSYVRDDVLRELVYTNRAFSGEEAQSLGFATHLSSDPHADAMAMAREIAARNPAAIQAAKGLMNDLADMDAAAILAAESSAQAQLLGTPNQIEAVMAAMTKRPPQFRVS